MIGCGFVGSASVFALMQSGLFTEIKCNSFEMKLWEIIPRQKQVFDWKTCKNVAVFLQRL